jgi:cytochrome c oxidase subunit 2
VETTLPSLLGGLFLLAAAGIAGVFALFFRRLRAENRSPDEAPVPRSAAPRRAPGRYWWVAAAVVAIAVAVCCALLAVDRLFPSAKPLVVKVTAHQFGWRFDYFTAVDPGTPGLETVPDPRGNGRTLALRSLGVSTTDRLTLPSDADVLFLVTSVDVIHRFWVPEFLVRRDIVPGTVAPVWAHPTRTGRFVVRSDDVCGAGDRLMVAALSLVDGRDFRDWLASRDSKTGDGSSAD